MKTLWIRNDLLKNAEETVSTSRRPAPKASRENASPETNSVRNQQMGAETQKVIHEFPDYISLLGKIYQERD